MQNTIYTDSNQNFDSKVFESKLISLKEEKLHLKNTVDSLSKSIEDFIQKRKKFKIAVELFEENVQKAAMNSIQFNFKSNETKNLLDVSFEVILCNLIIKVNA
jgi:ABC-type transport system involved in cytochrome bd biosynthesis fused ATPase/permease subunit